MQIVDFFTSLADPTRLRIVNLLLRSGELCVCDIYEVLQLSQPKVSRHLAFLKLRGLLLDRSVGLWSLYSLNEDLLTKEIRVTLTGLFESEPMLQKDIQRFDRRVGAKCCVTFVSIPGIRKSRISKLSSNRKAGS